MTVVNPAPGFVKNPNHRIRYVPSDKVILVTAGGQAVARSDGTIFCMEGDYKPVVYFPPEGVDMSALSPSEHTTNCPYKGLASYWNLGGLENVAWAYETPYDEALAIKGYIAFYPDKVESIAEI